MDLTHTVQRSSLFENWNDSNSNTNAIASFGNSQNKLSWHDTGSGFNQDIPDDLADINVDEIRRMQMYNEGTSLYEETPAPNMNISACSDNHAIMVPSDLLCTQVDPRYIYSYHDVSRDTENQTLLTTSNISNHLQTEISPQIVQNENLQNGSQILNESYLKVSLSFLYVIEESLRKHAFRENDLILF